MSYPHSRDSDCHGFVHSGICNICGRRMGQDSQPRLTHNGNGQYLVIGRMVQGGKFRLVHSNWHYVNSLNLYEGRIWMVQNGHRQLVKRITN